MNDRDFTFAEKLKIGWATVYSFAALTFLFRLISFWDVLVARPFAFWNVLFSLFNLLFLAVPIALGLLFRIRLEREYAVGSILQSAFQICSYAIPILLATSYIAMFLYEGL